MLSSTLAAYRQAPVPQLLLAIALTLSGEYVCDPKFPVFSVLPSLVIQTRSSVADQVP